MGDLDRSNLGWSLQAGTTRPGVNGTLIPPQNASHHEVHSGSLTLKKGITYFNNNYTLLIVRFFPLLSPTSPLPLDCVHDLARQSCADMGRLLMFCNRLLCFHYYDNNKIMCNRLR